MTTEQAKALGLLPADYVDPNAPRPVPTGGGIMEQVEAANLKGTYKPLSVERMNEILRDMGWEEDKND